MGVEAHRRKTNIFSKFLYLGVITGIVAGAGYIIKGFKWKIICLINNYNIYSHKNYYLRIENKY